MSSSSDSPFSQSDDAREAVRRYVEQLRAFYIHATVFAVGMVVIFVVNLVTNIAAGLTGEWWAWWSGWALIGWGLGVAIHGLVVRLSRPRGSTPSWTDRKINEILSENNYGPLS
ncbi:MAG: 2TM domain-containing protein [Acidimicrobiales bacterium]